MIKPMTWPQIEDEQVKRKNYLKQLYKEMESLKQTYLRLEIEYKEKKRTYEEIDKHRALHDGRLRIVKPAVKPPKPKQEMTQEQIMQLIEELGNLVK